MNLSVEQQFVLCCAKINWARTNARLRLSAKSNDGLRQKSAEPFASLKDKLREHDVRLSADSITSELNQLLHRQIGWENVIQIAGGTGVSPLVYHVLDNIVDYNVIPQSVTHKLHQVYQSNAIRNLLLYEELKRIIQAADEKSIPVIVLKGAALALSVYPNIALRTMGDIDLLVHQEHLETMDTIMRRFGYESNRDNIWDENENYHLPKYIRHPYQIEIHWNLVPPDISVTLDLSGIWARAQHLQIGNVTALMLAPEDLVIHLCLHVSAHHLFQVRPLRNLCDIAATIHYYRDNINWQQMHQWAKDSQIGGYIALTLILVKEVLDMPIRENIIRGFYSIPFDDESIDCIITEIWTPSKKSESELAPLDIAVISTQKSLLATLKAVMRCIFPRRKRLSVRFKVPPYSPLIYPYYLIYIFDRIKRRGFFLFRLIFRDKAALTSMASRQRQEKIRQWLEFMRREE